MAFSGTIATTCTVGGTTSSTKKTYTSGAMIAITEAVTASTNDQLQAFTLDLSQCLLFWMNCTVDVTVEFNSNVGGGGTIDLIANVPYFFSRTTVGAASDTHWVETTDITADITSIYVSVAGATAGTFTAMALYDPTV